MPHSLEGQSFLFFYNNWIIDKKGVRDVTYITIWEVPCTCYNKKKDLIFLESNR